MAKNKETFVQALGRRALSAALTLMALLPLAVLYRIADIIAWVLASVIKYRRKIVMTNLANSFPEMTEKERKVIARKFYTHLADVIVESIKLLHISDKELDRRIRVEGGEIVNNAVLGRGHGVILFLAHYGNWEWVPDIARFYSPKIHSYHVYKALRDHASQYIFNRIRSRFNSRGIEQTEVLRSIIGKARAGEPFICGFISDQRANWADTHHRLIFLGQPTQVLTGAEALGRKTGCEFMYLDVKQPRRGRYVFTIKSMELPADLLNADMPYTRLYYRMLEQTIRRQPWLWLWSHRRWLYH